MTPHRYVPSRFLHRRCVARLISNGSVGGSDDDVDDGVGFSSSWLVLDVRGGAAAVGSQDMTEATAAAGRGGSLARTSL